ncbi:MAG: PAS domain S-box protein [Bacteroidales bacterium]|nr:PAS domain S-box protein [Bacteroidales bacterium]
MKKTLRNTLLIWFLAFSVLIILMFLGFNLIYIHQKSNVTNITGAIYELHLDVQKDFNLTDAFFSDETLNQQFFKTGESSLLKEHAQKFNKAISKLGSLKDGSYISRMNIETDLDSLQTDLQAHNKVFIELADLTRQRGFKDYGIVGTMRSFVHQLEGYPQLDQADVLGLRRHEKDYIIRNEAEYITKLNELAGALVRQVKKDPAIGKTDREKIIGLINNYQAEFNALVAIEKKIGIRTPESGKKLELSLLEERIEMRFNTIIDRAEIKKVELLRTLEIFYAFFYLVFLLTSIFLSRKISVKIAAPLTKLTSHIKNLSGNNLRLNDNLDPYFENYETSILYQEFKLLIEQIKKEKEDLQRSQLALTENEEKYRQLANNLPQAVFETDQFGNLSYVNSSWLNTFNYTLEEVEEGMNITTVLKTESGPLVLGDESKGSITYKAVRKDGSTLPCLVYTNRIHRNNKLRGFRGAIIDISDRVKKKSK